jgi:hypothetical protein
MSYSQFKRFMWFPLFRRFLYACSAFKYAWNNLHPTINWSYGYYGWQRNTMPFHIVGLDALRKKEQGVGIEPFMLKKHCVNSEGETRYFDVVPEGWVQYDPLYPAIETKH